MSIEGILFLVWIIGVPVAMCVFQWYWSNTTDEARQKICEACGYKYAIFTTFFATTILAWPVWLLLFCILWFKDEK